MDRKILRLALVIAVSLFVGTVFTGCNDGEDASEPYLLKKDCLLYTSDAADD